MGDSWPWEDYLTFSFDIPTSSSLLSYSTTQLHIEGRSGYSLSGVPSEGSW